MTIFKEETRLKRWVFSFYRLVEAVTRFGVYVRGYRGHRRTGVRIKNISYYGKRIKGKL